MMMVLTLASKGRKNNINLSKLKALLKPILLTKVKELNGENHEPNPFITSLRALKKKKNTEGC